MSEWRPVQLADLIDVKHGFAFAGEFFASDRPGDVLATPGNFAIGGGFQWGRKKYYRGPVPADFVLQPRDLIVTMTDLSKGADTLGYSAIVPEAKERLLHNQRVGKVLQKNSDADLGYLYWLLRSRGYRDEILASATGSTVKHTSPKRILAFRFLLPSKSEQHGIAAVLSALDDKIDLNRRMNETLEAMAQTIFRDWFVRFGPTRAIMEGTAPYFAPELWALFPKQLDEEGKPEGWETRPLDQVARFLNGLALQKYPSEGSNSLPVIKIPQLRAGQASRDEVASGSLPSDYIVKDGDLLFSWSGSLLQRIWSGGPGALNQHLFKVTPSGVPQWFVYEWIAEYMESFRATAASKATTMGHIQRHHLAEAATYMPGPVFMKAADSLIAPQFAKMLSNDLEARTLAATRDLLLPKLISGEIRIREAERTVETML